MSILGLLSSGARVILFILASLVSFVTGSGNSGFHFTELVRRGIEITSEEEEKWTATIVRWR